MTGPKRSPMHDATLDRDQVAVLAAITAGGHVHVRGGPGTGKTEVALQAFRDAFVDAESDGRDNWAPGLLLTADRRRAAALESRFAQIMPRQTSGLRSDGSHRLIRSLNSYAYLVLGLWLVERDEPLPRPHLLSGAEEDAWLSAFVDSQPAELAGNSYAFLSREGGRMQVRNLMARAGEAGLTPKDLTWLANGFATPLWKVGAAAYASYAGEESAFTLASPHLDAARLPLVAANVLANWNSCAAAEGVHSPIPVPSRVIVDDAQDLPISALTLLRTLADCGSQVVVVGNEDQASAQYRGGVADLGTQVLSALGGQSFFLAIPHRGSAPTLRAVKEVERWLHPVLESVPTGATGSETIPGCGVTAHRVTTQSQMAERVAAVLRERHLHGGADWKDLAVVVRHSGALEGLQRALARNGVPVQSGERPVILSRIPIVRAMLTLLDVQQEEPEESQDRAALDLVISPLIGADSLAVFRVLRNFRAHLGAEAPAGMSHLLESLARGTYDLGGGSRLHDTHTALLRAAAVWDKRESARAMDPQRALWELWDASAVATQLREVALQHSAAGRLAAEQLDAVLALFRRADLWSQEQAQRGVPAATAADFAAETLNQTVATDPLVPRGLAETGVWVVTPAQAAGRQWKSVVVAGLEEGTWPAPDTATDAENVLLAALHDARLRGWLGQSSIRAFLPDQGAFAGLDRASQRGQRRREEAALFLVALSRSSDRVDLVAVDNEELAPSAFFEALVTTGVAHKAEQEGVRPLGERALTLNSLVAQQRRRLTTEDCTPQDRTEAARVLALLSRLEVEGAHPSSWGTSGSLSTDNPVLGQGPLRLGPSSIQSAQECPLRWFLADVGGRNQELHAEAQALDGAFIGWMIHTLAEENPEAGPTQMRQKLKELWNHLGLPLQTYWQRQAFDEVSEMVARMGAHFAGFDGQVLTEQNVSFTAGEVRVSGRVDRIEIDDSGQARVIDVKSGKTDASAKAEDNAQLTAYQIGVTELGYKSAGAALLALRSRSPLRFQEPLDGDALETAKAEISSLAGPLGGPRLAATPASGNCRTCPFRQVCPAQIDSVRSCE